jgi:hypothetical protein
MRSLTFARPARTLIAGMAACLAIGLAAGPALAAATWTIKPGGTMTLTSATRTAIKDSATGATLTCAAANLSGRLKPGSGLGGNGAGSITGGAASRCEGPGPLPWHITLPGLPWHLSLLAYDASTGLVHATISHLEISAAGSGCSFVTDGTRGGASDGTVKFTYSDRTHQVKTTGGNLHIFTVHGCSGLVASGDPASLTASFTLAPAQTITSP